MARRRSRIDGGRRMRRLFQNMAKEDSEITRPLDGALRRGAETFRDAIQTNIVSQGLVDEGDLFDSVAIVRNRRSFRYIIGFPKRGAKRKWELAGWKAHFFEFGFRNEPARPIVRPALDEHGERVIRQIERAVDNALERFTAKHGRR